MMRSACFFILLFFCTSCNVNDNVANRNNFFEKCRKLVLSENKKNQQYFFKKIDSTISERTVSYIGNANIEGGKTVKIIISFDKSGYFEDSKIVSSAVYLYDKNDNVIGGYFGGGAWARKVKIQNGSLIFSYDDSECNLSTVISLEDSIPRQIFINCNEGGGSIYSFSKDIE